MALQVLSRTAAGLAGGLALATAALTPAQAADWSDTSLGVRYSSQFAEPGISGDIAKVIYNLSYVSGDKYGMNLFVGDILTSDSKDPAAGGGGGAQEFYGFYQRTFSLSQLGTGGLKTGVTNDVSLVGRVDFGTKNTDFAPRPRKLRVGALANIAVPQGFWDVGVELYKETNHNGITGKDVSFDVTGVLTSAWAIPVGGVGTFGGFFDYVGKKGKDGFGGDTAAETLLRATFMFDVMGPKSGIKAGVGYEYWKNKFGNPASVPGSLAKSPLLLVEYHL
jgi:hypothetical protein